MPVISWSSRFGFILGIVLITVPLQAKEGRAGGELDFAREVLPILSNKCFVCHGPDTKKKDLVRLDSYAGATRDLDGYRAIDPTAPEKSEILVRLRDADDPMPPKKAEKQLTATERDILSRWVRQGGQYADHWAFVPPLKAPAPGSSGHVIDRFVKAGLSRSGVTMAPEADRPTLARRLSLVLRGLPPEPDRLAAFLADKEPGAYERFVDELLRSPRYGEHQARYWLDAVRYGDTHGLHLDNRRAIFPYRDWVVQALNENLPLDKFIVWQLAGDLLPDPTLSQQVATGFVRMNPTTAEGGAIPAEFQAKNNFDRVETVGTVLMGMTLICARCHTHKYDPITQTEYYRLLAFFNSTAESSMDGNKYEYGPVIKAPPNVAAWRAWNEFEKSRDALMAKAAPFVSTPDKAAALVAHAKSRAKFRASEWRVSKPVNRNQPAPAEAEWTDTKGLPGVLKSSLPKSNQSIWMSFKLAAAQSEIIQFRFSGGRGSKLEIDGKPFPSTQLISLDERYQIAIVPIAAGEHRLRIQMVGPRQGTKVELRITTAWDAVRAKNGKWGALSETEQLLLMAASDGPMAQLNMQSQAIDVARRRTVVTRGFAPTLVARDLPKPRSTRLLQRGEYDQPFGDPLQPGVMAVMGAMPEGSPPNRLGLARWLTSRDHPLTARVLVNRLWYRTFGDGLVRTPEDFGLQGEQPTHPALLDWLAVELQESGWDLKHMLRLMVTSRTFRQNSAWRADVDDPENRLLARGPGHRLDAEVIRDIALWASGLLDPEMGGEGVKPYQPPGMWSALMHPGSNTKLYVRDKGQKL
ncbi:MAG: PSD1 and planctomycete cytochrome C domain-containing protein, partial [Phycisphaerae bacterium]|nr:PSD1 and planctomycete cytochrome C domain-containing protein [Phycisphaerae bacterium]